MLGSGSEAQEHAIVEMASVGPSQVGGRVWLGDVEPAERQDETSLKPRGEITLIGSLILHCQGTANQPS
jgi:hypothetical protein